KSDIKLLSPQTNAYADESAVLLNDSRNFLMNSAPPDGIQKRYALIINGGYEDRFWQDMVYLYDMLLSYNFSQEEIYLLNHNGTNPAGENPDNMIDYSATKENIEMVCNNLSEIIDGDDILYIWIDDHGRGYNGPVQHTAYTTSFYGYLDGAASVDPGDEQDYLENEFKLRALYTGGNYRGNHGMDIWRVYYQWSSTQSAYRYYRVKYISHFDNIYFSRDNITQSDNDIWIEKFVDYLEGDLNKDGYIQTSSGETYDYDLDGRQPYDNPAGIFDEDDWGAIDYFEDDYNYLSTQMPEGGFPYKIFDMNLDNHLNIDLGYAGGTPQIDGTDLDNAGLFDGIDVNQDGDKDDWVSIDEKICVLYDDITDDEFEYFIRPIAARATVIILEPCFSGGFLEDLSRSNRVIFSATEEETVSWGNLFIRNTITAFSGINYPSGTNADPSLADADNNGYVTMLEAFNFSAEYDTYPEVPLYDDNADGIPNSFPIPIESDGQLGSIITLSGDNIGSEIPTAEAGPDKITYLYEDVIFDASSSYDIDGNIIDYQWNFGDGNLNSGKVVAHNYSNAATYEAQLTVTDNDGLTDRDTCFVTVEGEPSECGDSVTQGIEVCDGNSQQCLTAQNYNGTRACNATCDGWLGCVSGEYCGDLIINGNEVCDGDSRLCTTQEGDQGVEICNSQCDGFGECVKREVCGDGYCAGLANGEDCSTCPQDCIGGSSSGSCSACWKGLCDGSCNPRKETSDCADCAMSYCCGDGVCSDAESISNCLVDCGCSTNADCDDGTPCSTDSCNAGVCENTWPACGISDGCCASSCSSANDSDCAVAPPDCSTCFKGVCDGTCWAKKENATCPDCQ
ncbi:MAG: PKD domain-containing protein, partial [Candidatus Omnitrophica bacterium]|nr:PKD domain-containing protein [Candidatus Omnitrophota bacterium]